MGTTVMLFPTFRSSVASSETLAPEHTIRGVTAQGRIFLPWHKL